MAVEIRAIYISPAVLAKITSKHGVSADDVLDACHGPARAGWNDDPTRGRRLLVEGRNSHGRRVFVVLYPGATPGLWNLGTARFM